MKKMNGSIIVMLCCIFVCICVVTAFAIFTYQNNKKIAIENATERINELLEEVYEVNYYNEDNYLLAKDQLSEVKTLIDENKLEGLPVDKYDKACKYITDLGTLNEIYNLYSEYNTDKESYAREVNKLISKISDEKVLNRIKNIDDTLASCSSAVKSVILGKAFYAAQRYFVREYPDYTFCEIGYFNPYTNVSSDYTVTIGGLTNTVSMDGVQRMLTDADDGSNHEYITTSLSDDTVNKIRANGGHAIVIRYEKSDDQNYTYYTPSGSVFWYVGVDVVAEIVDGSVRYTITRYSSGEATTSSELVTNDALNFEILNPK